MNFQNMIKFHISQNITSYTFLLVFKIVKGFQRILNSIVFFSLSETFFDEWVGEG